ncbi:hypothetical protein JOQ06_024913 [Pogonophryne albipinna]|uniref:Uncharacterized protein n=1 Tax=Pogonophryne albipinna TaxID=1090488 RepID=A0AAD6FDG7_9TELE|nr:hypothetical protein JOQ06_024913 [Pogonophryne albipinna]
MFSDSDRRRGREDGKRDERQGLFLEALGGMFAEKQVGGWVMREDSWQVQGRESTQVKRGQGRDLHLPHLSINDPSASVPTTLRSPQPRRAPNNKSLDPATLRQPAQSKYLKPLYLISPGSRH